MDELRDVNPLARMDVLVFRTLGILTGAVEAAVNVPAGTIATLANPSLEKFARDHFGPRKERKNKR